MNEWKCWGFWRFILSISTLAWMLYSNWIKVNNACVNTTQIGNTCKKKTTNIRFDQYINLANNSWRIKDQLDVLAILFHLLCAQHILDINIYIIRSLRLFCWITTLVVLFCKDGGFTISVNYGMKWCVFDVTCLVALL